RRALWKRRRLRGAPVGDASRANVGDRTRAWRRHARFRSLDSDRAAEDQQNARRTRAAEDRTGASSAVDRGLRSSVFGFRLFVGTGDRGRVIEVELISFLRRRFPNKQTACGGA